MPVCLFDMIELLFFLQNHPMCFRFDTIVLLFTREKIPLPFFFVYECAILVEF